MNKNKVDLHGKIIVSFSQYSMFKECPWKWKLSYIDKHKTFTENIHTLFGTSLHETLQCYLIGLYSKGEKFANTLKLDKILEYRLKENYKISASHHDFKKFTSSSEMASFYNQGIEILEWIKKHRSYYFGLRGYELVGVEIPLLHKISDNHVVYFYAFIDIIIKDKKENKYKVIDIKTSTRGWSQEQKKNEIKMSQLLLYKYFYSKQFNIPIENIDVEFFIVKRELMTNVDFPQKRVQRIEPASGKIKMSKLLTSFEKFIEHCFNEDGTYKNSLYEKNPSNENCKYCPFNHLPQLCDKKND